MKRPRRRELLVGVAGFGSLAVELLLVSAGAAGLSLAAAWYVSET
ncbi:hypothetical protein [Halapricum sp. CBA1109]|nr:hypothetical protein [Halapricum sp. CBA1109]